MPKKQNKGMQLITSAKTSRKQVATGLRKAIKHGLVPIREEADALDYGGGKYDEGKDFMREHWVNLRVYDPYNRSAEENRKARINRFYEAIFCNNVLNVLESVEAINDVLDDMAYLQVSQNVSCRIIISVYEGDGSGIGRKTRDGYQRNEKLNVYLELVKDRFSPSMWKVGRKHGMIIIDFDVNR